MLCLRWPLCAGEALLEARTQASLFKLGAHSSATLQPELEGLKV